MDASNSKERKEKSDSGWKEHTLLLWVTRALGLAVLVIDFIAALWNAVTTEAVCAAGEGENGFALSYAKRLAPAHGLECVIAHVDERTL